MKRKNRITLITNISLVLIITFVFSVGFFTNTSVETYGGKENSPIYLGNKDNKNVSIMVNVYENTLIVNEMIDLFMEKNIKATFFVGGCWADDNEKTLLKMKENGFEIGNHGYFHKDHKKLTKENNIKEIENCGKIIESFTGLKPNLFAPPSGSYSFDTLVSAEELNYKVIMWSKDTIDWRDSDLDLIYNRATVNDKNGDLILMHPKKHTLEILPKIIDFYLKKGYNLTTVGENIEGL